MQLLSHGLTRALIAAASLAICGCAAHEDIRSVSYDYTGGRRLAAERRANQDMQDSCYFSGYQYFRPEGSPQVVSTGARVLATQAFSCVGTVGGP